MLSNEENELLCRVGPGTPMGDLLRQYWMPGLPSRRAARARLPAQAVRLLGEDLVAFRDTPGEVGLLAANCPHRGASLFFGRNEECGLRCVYHGWKFDVTGRCVDMPNEPAESNFKDKVRARAYPCRDVNGVIWTYMGPRETAPPLPGLRDQHPAGRPGLRRRASCWRSTTGCRGSRATSTRPTSTGCTPASRPDIAWQAAAVLHCDKRPRLEVLPTDYGAVLLGAGGAGTKTASTGTGSPSSSCRSTR